MWRDAISRRCMTSLAKTMRSLFLMQRRDAEGHQSPYRLQSGV
jgi:hypothetical protein